MYQPAPQTLSISSPKSENPFQLCDIRFDVESERHATFRATVIAPDGADAYARCWVSNAVEGGLAEAVVRARGGERIEMPLELNTESIPELASIRVESAPLQTKNVYGARLCKGELYFFGPLKLRLESIESAKAMIKQLSSEQRAEVSPQWLAMVESATESDGWIHGFTAFNRESGVRIGQGGFKGPPKDGSVEIAYRVGESFQQQGFGTAIAQALTKYAFGQSNDVDKIVAHAVPGHAASARILEKSDYQRIGEVEDPEDGTVIRWEKVRPSC